MDLLLLLFDECLLAILNKADSSFDLLLQERTIRTFAVSINVHLVFFAVKLINNFTGKVFMDVLTFIIMEGAFIVLIEVVVLFFLGFIRVFRAVTRSRIVLLLGILRWRREVVIILIIFLRRSRRNDFFVFLFDFINQTDNNTKFLFKTTEGVSRWVKTGEFH